MMDSLLLFLLLLLLLVVIASVAVATPIFSGSAITLLAIDKLCCFGKDVCCIFGKECLFQFL